MQTLELSIVKKTKYFQRVEFTLNNKLLHTPFFLLTPTNRIDLGILCNHIRSLNSTGKVLDCLGGVSYRVFDYDKIVENQNSMLNQLDLKRNRVSLVFQGLNKTRLKILKPATRLYRDRFREDIKRYKKLEKVPSYLLEHFDNLLSLPKKNIRYKHLLDVAHIRFWKDLSKVGKSGTEKTAHFINWHHDLQRNRDADIFLPPSPYITLPGVEFLTGKAIKVNILAQNMFDEDVATFFSMDAEIFRSKKSLERILKFIYDNPNKCRFVLFEIHNIEKIFRLGFGQSSMENLGLFLKTIKMMKETTDKIFGLLNGGGFGYCLLGIFDIFTDTVNNYTEYPMGRAGKRPRKWLNPITLYPENFEDVKNYWSEHGTLAHDCDICETYNKYKVLNKEFINLRRWSIDCKRHGLNVWNDVTREAINSINNGDDDLFFERIQRSAFIKLYPILRRVVL